MPLTTDEQTLALSNDILAKFETLFGAHPGFRPAHAKGRLLTGTFTPAPAATTLTSAPHLTAPSTPVTVRFSNSTGLPLIPDNNPNANPRGIGIRFHLGERAHTDIIAHSTDGFPARTGQEFLEFLTAIATTAPGMPSPTPVEAFLGTHPAALAFVQAPKPAPSSFARETYFGVTSAHFTNAHGETRFGRYRIVPELGNDFLDDTALAAQGPDYLFDELTQRASRDEPILFRILVQLANPGDIVDDATVSWPENRTFLDFGTLSLNALHQDSEAEQKQVIFDPIPRIPGIDPSADPLLELRAAIYLISGRRRRAAPTT